MDKTEKKRSYPLFYEKTLPFIIGLLAVIIIGMLVFTIAVGVGALKFG